MKRAYSLPTMAHCPSCDHAGPHSQTTTDYQCGHCGWRFVVNADGTTRDRFAWMTAGRKQRGKRPRS